MIARRFNIAKDYAQVVPWMKDREHEMPQMQRLPKFGVIIDGIACAFLIKTDAKIGLLDFFMSNPRVSEEDRLHAYDLGMDLLQKQARKLKLEVLVASSAIPKVMGFVMRHHMKGDGVPYYFFKKLLTNEVKENGRQSDSKPSAESASAGSNQT